MNLFVMHNNFTIPDIYSLSHGHTQFGCELSVWKLVMFPLGFSFTSLYCDHPLPFPPSLVRLPFCQYPKSIWRWWNADSVPESGLRFAISTRTKRSPRLSFVRIGPYRFIRADVQKGERESRGGIYTRFYTYTHSHI